MKPDAEKLVRDFLRWYERTSDRSRTVRMPGGGRIPPDIAALAKQLERELVEVREDEDTGVHRIEVLHRAMMSARPKDEARDPRVDSILAWRRKGVGLLVAIIASLIGTVGYLALRLIEMTGRK